MFDQSAAGKRLWEMDRPVVGRWYLQAGRLGLTVIDTGANHGQPFHLRARRSVEFEGSSLIMSSQVHDSDPLCSRYSRV